MIHFRQDPNLSEIPQPAFESPVQIEILVFSWAEEPAEQPDRGNDDQTENTKIEKIHRKKYPESKKCTFPFLWKFWIVEKFW